MTWQKQLSHYLIFLFLFFSFITKVEYGKILHDKSQSHKGCDNGHVTVMSQSQYVTGESVDK